MVADDPVGDPVVSEVTYADKFKTMRDDLAHIVDVMNIDGNFDTAMAAQAALVAVSNAEESVGEHFGDLDDLLWRWSPTEDDDG